MPLHIGIVGCSAEGAALCYKTIYAQGPEFLGPHAHQRVIEGLKNKSCDAVVLGCTEIPLIINDANSPPPTLDSTRLLARAALRRALA